MAEGLYDMIVAGVPHRVLETADVEIAGDKLGWGQTVRLDRTAADELEERHKFVVSTEPGPAARLAVALSFRGFRVGVIDLGSSPVLLQTPEQVNSAAALQCGDNHQLGSMAHACRLLFKDRTGSTATAIHYGAVNARAGMQSALLVRAAKVLCLEDRLWDVEGGAEFAAAAIDVAQSAGRMVVLVCKDPDCVVRNRISIRNVVENRMDYIVGEATTAQLLYDLERADMLIQKLRALSTGALLWRHTLAPLVLEGNLIGPAVDSEMIDATTFWKTALPVRLASLLQNGTVMNIPAQRQKFSSSI